MKGDQIEIPQFSKSPEVVSQKEKISSRQDLSRICESSCDLQKLGGIKTYYLRKQLIALVISFVKTCPPHSGGENMDIKDPIF